MIHLKPSSKINPIPRLILEDGFRIIGEPLDEFWLIHWLTPLVNHLHQPPWINQWIPWIQWSQIPEDRNSLPPRRWQCVLWSKALAMVVLLGQEKHGRYEKNTGKHGFSMV